MAAELLRIRKELSTVSEDTFESLSVPLFKAINVYWAATLSLKDQIYLAGVKIEDDVEVLNDLTFFVEQLDSSIRLFIFSYIMLLQKSSWVKNTPDNDLSYIVQRLKSIHTVFPLNEADQGLYYHYPRSLEMTREITAFHEKLTDREDIDRSIIESQYAALLKDYTRIMLTFKPKMSGYLTDIQAKKYDELLQKYNLGIYSRGTKEYDELLQNFNSGIYTPKQLSADMKICKKCGKRVKR